jgi:hypothetical protein
MPLSESDFLPSRRWQVRRRIHSAETLAWRHGLDKKLKQAREFYTLKVLLSTEVRVGLDSQVSIP